MSQHLDALALGDAIEVKGPLGHFVYEGRGSYTLNGKKGAARHSGGRGTGRPGGGGGGAAGPAASVGPPRGAQPLAGSPACSTLRAALRRLPTHTHTPPSPLGAQASRAVSA